MASLILWCAIGLSTAASNILSTQQTEPTLIVQLVDSGWTPVPGIDVKVTSVGSCQGKSASKERVSARTDRAGFARVKVPADANYLLSLAPDSGFLHPRRCVHIFPRNADLPTAYVQIQVHNKRIVIQ
jgi:hypothetical protein